MLLLHARVVELEHLVARDHAELERSIEAMSKWAPTADQRVTLDAARLGFAAHAEAEANILHRVLVVAPPRHVATRLYERMFSAHATQEALLWRLARSVPNTVEWVDALDALRSSFTEHEVDERLGLLPIVRELLATEDYQLLATSYATERLRALAMMSAVVARARAGRRTAHP